MAFPTVGATTRLPAAPAVDEVRSGSINPFTSVPIFSVVGKLTRWRCAPIQQRDGGMRWVLNLTLHNGRVFFQCSQWLDQPVELDEGLGQDYTFNVNYCKAARTGEDGKSYGTSIGQDLPGVVFVGSLA